MQRKSVPAPLLLAPLLAGCLGTLPPPEPPPYKGVRLTVACPADAVDLVRARSRVWAARQQASVTAEPCPPGDPAAVAGADAWVIAPAELPSWAARGELVGLPESLNRRGNPFDWAGLLPEYREQLLRWDRAPFAVPLAGEAPVCVYRSDLYARADVREKYRAWQGKRNKALADRKEEPPPVRELRAPATWEEFAAQAEFFRDHLGRPSLPPLPAGDAELDRLFYSVASPYARRAVRADERAGADHLDEVFSFHRDQKTGEPRVASPGFVAALALLKQLQACRPKEPSAAPPASFLEGEAVLCLTEASWLVRFQNRAALRDRFGVCQVPGSDRYFGKQGWTRLKDVSNRVPYLGGAGWLAVVPASSKQREAALDLLADMAGPASSAQTALEPRWGGPTRTEQLLRERWDAFDLDAERTAALKEALLRTLLEHRIKNPVLALRTPDQAARRAALVAEVRAALLEGKPAERALEDAARRWSELDARRGREAHRREYRISLGLPGD